MKRAHVFYSGLVQGVGFRYTARHAARECGVSGWVKNLVDGRVELVCEGKEQAVEGFLEEIRQGELKDCIRGESIKWEPATGEFNGFEIRF